MRKNGFICQCRILGLGLRTAGLQVKVRKPYAVGMLRIKSLYHVIARFKRVSSNEEGTEYEQALLVRQ